MGADGHIAIMRRERVLQYPDGVELLSECGTHYLHELDGVEYDHIYWGDNIWVGPWDADGYYFPSDMGDEAIAKRRKQLQEFLDWFYGNSTHWEVWT